MDDNDDLRDYFDHIDDKRRVSENLEFGDYERLYYSAGKYADIDTLNRILDTSSIRNVDDIVYGDVSFRSLYRQAVPQKRV